MTRPRDTSNYARETALDAPRTLTFSVHFTPGKTRHRRLQRGPEPPAPAPRGQVPRISRVLALAHHFAAMIRAGEVADYADLARLTGFTRARITQMMDLTLLAPDIQEQILTWPRVTGERGAPSEKRVLAVAREVEWERQRVRWLVGVAPLPVGTAAGERHVQGDTGSPCRHFRAPQGQSRRVRVSVSEGRVNSVDFGRCSRDQ